MQFHFYAFVIIICVTIQYYNLTIYHAVNCVIRYCIACNNVLSS